MKNIKGFIIILIIYFISLFIENALPITIPATIIGIILLTALLVLGIIKLDDVKRPSEIMRWLLAILFVPSFVSALFSIGLLMGDLFKIAIIFIASSLISTISVAYITDKLARGEINE